MFIGGNRKGLVQKFIGLFNYSYRLFRIMKKENVSLAISAGSPYVAVAGWFSRIPAFQFIDTEHASLNLSILKIFSDKILTPSCFIKKLGRKHSLFESYLELAYLHPAYFKPNPTILKELGVKKGEKYFILRFVGWEASHDIGHSGLTIESKRELIKLLIKYGKVFISSEKPLPKEFERFNLSTSPEKMHNVLYYATMYVGEGGTMVTESALLGTPAVYISSLAGTMGNFIDLEEKYGLSYSFKSSDNAFKKIEKLLKNKSLKKEWQEKRKTLLHDKIDMTKWMVKMIENTNDK